MAARPPVDRGAVLRATASCVRFGDAVSVARNVDFPLMQVNGVPVEARKTGRSASVTAIASRRSGRAAERRTAGEWRTGDMVSARAVRRSCAGRRKLPTRPPDVGQQAQAALIVPRGVAANTEDVAVRHASSG
ncbi:TPA: hypothetical protein QDA89_005261 [Burkholderia vietnamiensis]|uniref:hypothetical protein n=1 Tax=Burkholderia vietnamiensis TaxID=60552 RepID=UPI0026541FC0|nr:hypothetical protein [Burkholderia vietnamiensis]MDN8074643.1 hypothetical protein [Burkholderia vietnamiensis]HDR8986273.1 hypothetical protein [Burkholderia vietnamiensis]